MSGRRRRLHLWLRGGWGFLRVRFFPCEKEQQWQQALSLLAVTRQTCIRPGAISGSAVISAGEKDQQWLQALGLLDLMQQTRVLLGVISYSAGISAFEKGHVLLGS